MLNGKTENTTNALKYRSFLILISGMIVSAGLGIVIFDLYSTAQKREFERDYEVLATGTVQAAGQSLDRMCDACRHAALMYSGMFPDVDQWPNVGLPRFATMVEPLIYSLNAKNLNHIPLVLPSQLPSFETFAYDFFASDPDTKQYPNLGVSHFGKGVFAVNSSGVRFHDTSGQTAFTDASFLAPIFQIGKISTNSKIVMLNTHYEKIRGTALNAVIDCFYENTAVGTSTIGCGALTDVIYLLQDTSPIPSSIFYYPEYPGNNESVLSGFIGVVFNWDSILKVTVRDFGRERMKNKVLLVLRSPTSVFSYTVSSDSDVVFSEADSPYSGEHSKYRRTAVIDGRAGTAAGSVPFLLDVYPHDSMVDMYFTSKPIIFATIASCIMFAIVLVVFYVDYFITSQVYEVQVTSKLQKTFLRYVSHELRSPLNAVYMGVTELLCMDDYANIGHQTQSCAKADECQSNALEQKPALTKRDVARNIKLDTEMAIVVLDDLLTYVTLVDSKKDRSRRSSVICLRLLVTDSVRSIKHMFSENDQHVNIQSYDNFSSNGEHLFPTIRGLGADIKMMLIYLLKVAAKMCPPGKEIKISFSLQTPGQFTQRTKFDHLVQVSVSYPSATYHAEQISLLKRSSSNINQFSMDKLRTNSTRDFVTSDLGNWIFYHIASRYQGKIDIFNDDSSTSIVLEFPHAVGSECSICAGHSFKPTQNVSMNSPQLASSSRSTEPHKVSPVVENGASLIRTPPLDLDVNIPSDTKLVKDIQNIGKSVSLRKIVPHNYQLPPLEKGLHILCVDDVPSNRKILSRLLIKKGHTCSLACDGQEAISIVGNNDPRVDVICMDYEMPVMDGPTAAKILRDMGVRTPIIGVTGNVLPQDIEYFKKMGADEVIGKPVDITALLEVVRCLIYADQVRREQMQNSSRRYDHQDRDAVSSGSTKDFTTDVV